jgi:hypothetical protein
LLIARVIEYDRDFIPERSESSFKFSFTLHVVVATVALGDTPDGFAILHWAFDLKARNV